MVIFGECLGGGLWCMRRPGQLFLACFCRSGVWHKNKQSCMTDLPGGVQRLFQPPRVILLRRYVCVPHVQRSFLYVPVDIQITGGVRADFSSSCRRICKLCVHKLSIRDTADVADSRSRRLFFDCFFRLENPKSKNRFFGNILLWS